MRAINQDVTFCCYAKDARHVPAEEHSALEQMMDFALLCCTLIDLTDPNNQSQNAVVGEVSVPRRRPQSGSFKAFLRSLSINNQAPVVRRLILNPLHKYPAVISSTCWVRIREDEMKRQTSWTVSKLTDGAQLRFTFRMDSSFHQGALSV
ncbi:hypothetical protein MHYP_G00090030 [Metynnis hypsauchen]